MAARAGIEPVLRFLQYALADSTCENSQSLGAQIDAQIFGELAQVLAAWFNLDRTLRRAVIAIVEAAKGGGA